MTLTNSMVLPKIEAETTSRNYGKFIISPLESGYGVTLGNALRRVLLSSLDGAAITSLRVSDVPHEFSDIPGVKEDMTQLLLQVKQLRLILHEGDSSRPAAGRARRGHRDGGRHHLPGRGRDYQSRPVPVHGR
jgi:DNA-directed RNA polymerase subunit alpha